MVRTVILKIIEKKSITIGTENGNKENLLRSSSSIKEVFPWYTERKISIIDLKIDSNHNEEYKLLSLHEEYNLLFFQILLGYIIGKGYFVAHSKLTTSYYYLTTFP
jgi:hypothetical protein